MTTELRKGYSQLQKWIDEGMKTSPSQAFTEGDVRFCAELLKEERIRILNKFNIELKELTRTIEQVREITIAEERARIKAEWDKLKKDLDLCNESNCGNKCCASSKEFEKVFNDK